MNRLLFAVLLALAGCRLPGPNPAPTPSPIASATPIATASPSPAPSASPAPTASPTVAPTASPSPAPTTTPTASPSPASTPSANPSPTASPSPSPAPTATPSGTPSPAPSGSPIPAVLSVAADVGKSQGPFTDSEITALAGDAIVAINLNGKVPGDFPSIPAGVQSACSRVAAVNPAAVCLQYWGFSGLGHHEYSFYSDPAFQQSWWVQQPGEKQPRLDITQQAERDLWTTYATSYACAVRGLFIDGLEDTPKQNGSPWAEAKIAMFAELRAKMSASCPGAIVIANGDPGNLVASGLAPYIDGIFLEPYDLYTSAAKTPDQNLAYLQSLGALAASGKVAILKAWPWPYSFLADGSNASPPAAPSPPWPSGVFTSWPYDEQLAWARQSSVDAFVLASYAMIEGPTTSLDFSWGYGADGGQYALEDATVDPSRWIVDLAWYPGLLEPLGIPLGPATWNGYVGTRIFSAGVVTVDLQAHAATLP